MVTHQDVLHRQMPGAMLLTEIKLALDGVLKNTRGQILLQIGGPFDESLTESARIAKTVLLSAHFSHHHQRPFIQGESDCLPIESESIDVVLLMHQLYRKKQAWHVLQEAYRVLKPNGKIIVVNHNRWGLWQFLRWFFGKNYFAKHHHFFSASQVKRYFEKMQCELMQHQTVCFRPPFESIKSAKRWRWIEKIGPFFFPYFGAAFVICAKKNVMGVTPLIEKIWSQKIPLTRNNGFVQPTTRNR